MRSGKCNLLLIKTSLLAQAFQTDSDLQLSSSHFSPPLLSSYFSSVASPTLVHPSPSFYLNSSLSPRTSCPFFLLSTLSTSTMAPLSILSPALQSQHHEEEKRALSREIIVLNNHLMEAKITINKLRDDNVSNWGHILHYELPLTSLSALCIYQQQDYCNTFNIFGDLRTYSNYFLPVDPQIKQ